LLRALKQGRLDYLVQKAVEMGAGVLQPVITQHTQAKAGTDASRPMRSRRLSMRHPRHPGGARRREARSLAFRLGDGPAAGVLRRDASTNNPLPALAGHRRKKLGLLVGPEGGFSDAERQQLRALPFVTAIPLGPRILRADTAAVAALALMQAAIGDW